MKIVAFLVVVLVASSSANTARYNLAVKYLQGLESALTTIVTSAQSNLTAQFKAEITNLQQIEAAVKSEVSSLKSAQVTSNVSAIISTVTTAINTDFVPSTLAKSIVAPFVAAYNAAVVAVLQDIAVLNGTSPPVTLACLQSANSTIQAAITSFVASVNLQVNQQLQSVQQYLNNLNGEIISDLNSIQNSVIASCGTNTTCAVSKVLGLIPGIQLEVNLIIAQQQTAFDNFVSSAGNLAQKLSGTFWSEFPSISGSIVTCSL